MKVRRSIPPGNHKFSVGNFTLKFCQYEVLTTKNIICRLQVEKDSTASLRIEPTTFVSDRICQTEMICIGGVPVSKKDISAGPQWAAKRWRLAPPFYITARTCSLFGNEGTPHIWNASSWKRGRENVFVQKFVRPCGASRFARLTCSLFPVPCSHKTPLREHVFRVPCSLSPRGKTHRCK